MSPGNPYAPPQAELNDGVDEGADIDSLPVSDAWKERFRAMRAAGGPWTPRLNALPPEVRKKTSPINYWAFFFGPLYYLAKGMWRKAITIFVLGATAILLVDLALIFLAGIPGLGSGLGVAFGFLWGMLANRDYYSKMVLGRNGWWW